MRRLRRAGACFILACASASLCAAQPASPAKYEVNVGARWVGPIAVASELANEAAAGGTTRSLFSSHTRLGAGVGVAAGFGVQLSRAIRAEMSASYGTTQLNSKVSADAEQVADITVHTPVEQLVVEAGVLAQRSRWRDRRLQPFVTAGVAYLREMYEGRTLIETGSALYAGGGLYYVRASARSRHIRATGLRIDLRGQMRRGGVASSSNIHAAPEVTAGVFVRF